MMPSTAEELVFRLTAKVAGFEDEMTVASAVFNKAASSIESGFGRLDKRIEEASRNSSANIKAMVATLTGALGAREVMAYADAWTNAKNALVAAKVPAVAQASVLGRLYQQSQDYSVELNAQTALYGQLSRAAKGLTSNGEDIFTFTEAVAAGLKADGKSAGEASGALLQLGQALRSPVIQAEEFNSLIDGAPSLLEAAANGIDRFNGDLGALIAAAKGGTLSSREFFEGVLAGSDELKSRVGQSADTFEGAYVRIGNALTKYIGQTDESLGASQRLIAALHAFADDFDNIADTVLKLAAVISGALVGRAIGGVLTTIPIAIIAFKLLSLAASGAAGAASFMAANFGGATRAIAGATLASRAFKLAAFGMVAGPIGAVIGTLVTTLAVFSDQLFSAGSDTESAAAMADRYAEALRRVRGASDDAGKSVEDTGKKFVQAETLRLEEQLKADAEEYRIAAEQVKAEIDESIERLLEVQDQYAGNPEYEKQLADLRAVNAGLDGTVEGAERAKDSLAALARSDLSFKGLVDSLGGLLDRLVSIGAEAVSAKTRIREMSEGPMIQDRASMYTVDPEYAGRAYIKEGERRNSLTKEALSLEEEIARVRKDSMSKGIALSGAQVEQLAKDNLAAAAARTTSGKKPKAAKEDDFQKESESVTERTDALNAEIAARQALNPLAADYNQKLLAAKTAQDLLTAAQKGGREVAAELTDVQKLLYGDLSKLTPAARQQAEVIRALSLGYADATTKTDALREAQQNAADAAKASIEFQKDLLNGALTDMRSALEDGKLTWEELGDVASNVLGKIADKLQSMLVDQLFDKGFVGLFGTLLGGATAATGGGLASAASAASSASIAKAAAPSSALKSQALTSLPSSRMTRPSALNNQPTEVVVSVDDEGAIRAYVKRENVRTATAVAVQTQKTFEQYRRNDLRSDIGDKLGRTRRRG